MAKGQFFKSGGQMFTTYDATSEGCKQLINDFYDGGWQAFYSSFARSAGSPVFDGGLNNTGYSGGFFNPKFGMDVTAAMFTSKKVSSALPKEDGVHIPMSVQEFTKSFPKMVENGLCADYDVSSGEARLCRRPQFLERIFKSCYDAGVCGADGYINSTMPRAVFKSLYYNDLLEDMGYDMYRIKRF